MKVTIKVGLSCAAGSFAAGEVADVPDDIGGSLLKLGYAELQDEERTADSKPVARKATKWPKSDPASDGT